MSAGPVIDPVQVDVEYPERLSRLLIFVKWLLLLPHYVALYVLNIVAFFVLAISWFAVIILGRYPAALFDFIVGFERWRLRVFAYLYLQTDRYPPFSFEEAPGDPVRLSVEFPERVARWRPIVCWLLVLPVLIVLAFYGLAVGLVTIVAWFAILFTGRFPRSLFDFVCGYERWVWRTTLYSYFMTPKYPLYG